MPGGHTILVINPGSTSTKIAVFRGYERLFEETLHHSAGELAPYKKIADQFEFRKKIVLRALEKRGIPLESLSAVVGRGGLLKPIPGGTYLVTEVMLRDLKVGVQGEHASNLGGLIAHEVADPLRIPSFIVDPVVVDELEPIARVSGDPEIERRAVWHALNSRAIAKRAAKELGSSYESVDLIVAHMGGGISVSCHRKGRTVDVNKALMGAGPFSPQRAGTLPLDELLKMCFSGKYTYEDLRRRFSQQGGLIAYLGTSDAQEVQRRIERGDKQAELVFEAMAYQVAKEVGAMATVLKGSVDLIVLTGGLAHSTMLVNRIRERVSFIAPVKVYPGEGEMESLAAGALAVLQGVEKANVYD